MIQITIVLVFVLNMICAYWLGYIAGEIHEMKNSMKIIKECKDLVNKVIKEVEKQ